MANIATITVLGMPQMDRWRFSATANTWVDRADDDWVAFVNAAFLRGDMFIMTWWYASKTTPTPLPTRRNYYTFLGLAEDADAATIQARFDLCEGLGYEALSYPGLGQNKYEEFTIFLHELERATEVLLDPFRKFFYDREMLEEGDATVGTTSRANSTLGGRGDSWVAGRDDRMLAGARPVVWHYYTEAREVTDGFENE